MEQSEKVGSQLLTLQEVRTLLPQLKASQFKVTFTPSRNQCFALTLADLYVGLRECLGSEQRRGEERAHIPSGAHGQEGGQRSQTPQAAGATTVPGTSELCQGGCRRGAGYRRCAAPSPRTAALPATHTSHQRCRIPAALFASHPDRPAPRPSP